MVDGPAVGPGCGIAAGPEAGGPKVRAPAEGGAVRLALGPGFGCDDGALPVVRALGAGPPATGAGGALDRGALIGAASGRTCSARAGLVGDGADLAAVAPTPGEPAAA
ncbi:MAG TPA: hypothetical protein VE617_14130, partial [Propionibacteriaceae bacterium]|nr:hypothetical protein [Propionibacteriaceae bacterium]